MVHVFYFLNIARIKRTFMHMSSACPRGRTPGQPGGYVGEYKGMDWILCPWGGENLRHCFKFEEKGGGGIPNFVKSRTATTGIYHFPQPINTRNITWRKGEFSDEKRVFER